MIDRSIMAPDSSDSDDVAAAAIRKSKRFAALNSRPMENVNIERIPCASCQTSIPIAWLEHEIFNKCLCVDGFIYCIKCAKQIVKGMQKELMGKSKEERVAYYKQMEDKIAEHEQIEKMKNENIVEEVAYDDVDKMKKLMRNRSGSTDSMTLKEQITDNVKKELHKEE